MHPLAFMGLGPQELIIILVIILLLFGGSRLAGLGKSSGRALKEFKEETRGLRDDPKAHPTEVTHGEPGSVPPTTQQPPYSAAPQSSPYSMPQPSDPPAGDVRRDV